MTESSSIAVRLNNLRKLRASSTLPLELATEWRKSKNNSFSSFNDDGKNQRLNKQFGDAPTHDVYTEENSRSILYADVHARLQAVVNVLLDTLRDQGLSTTGKSMPLSQPVKDSAEFLSGPLVDLERFAQQLVSQRIELESEKALRMQLQEECNWMNSRISELEKEIIRLGELQDNSMRRNDFESPLRIAQGQVQEAIDADRNLESSCMGSPVSALEDIVRIDWSRPSVRSDSDWESINLCGPQRAEKLSRTEALETYTALGPEFRNSESVKDEEEEEDAYDNYGEEDEEYLLWLEERRQKREELLRGLEAITGSFGMSTMSIAESNCDDNDEIPPPPPPPPPQQASHGYSFLRPEIQSARTCNDHYEIARHTQSAWDDNVEDEDEHEDPREWMVRKSFL